MAVNSFIRLGIAFILLLCLATNSVSADEDKVGWHGEGEFGLAITSGNSETETLNGSIKLINQQDLWRHTIDASALTVSDEDSTTAERYTFGYKASRKINESDYLFSAFRYDDDRFSGFDFQSSLTAGYGRRVFERRRSSLDIEAGLGYKFSETVEGEEQNEVIARLYGDYHYDVSDNAIFSQTLLIEPGPENTFSESVTAFKVGFAEKLALKLSFTAKNNSSTPAGTESTDTITSATVVYSF